MERQPVGRPAPMLARDRWVIHSAGNEEELPGKVVRREGEPVSADVAVDEAYTWSQQVWDLYEQQFGRASYDGDGSTVTVTVHFGQDYDNAFWDGSQLVFGDGDGVIFERFTKPADVLAHEFSHGVVQYTSGFVYRDQPGALNESVADVFAAMSVQHAAGQTADEATWLIGEGLFLPDIRARALRSMLEPGTAYDDPRLGKDPQVGSMADYVDTTDDNGGVHLNSGIPNRAFALAATGIGGHSWERAGRVWYEALTSDQVGPTTTFAKFAAATVTAATRLYPGTAVPDQVRAAWVTVGVLSGTNPPQAVMVRRSGGFTGQIRQARIELGEDSRGEEIRGLLGQLDLSQMAASEPMADRYVYTVEVDDQTIILGEQDLSPDLRRLVRIVLEGGADRPADPGPAPVQPGLD